MNNITSEVSQIETSLHSSRRQLQTLESSAKKSISSEVDGIRTALKNGDTRAENVTTQMRSFLTQVEHTDDADATVDMKPQMLWLRERLDVIVRDLDATKACADSAITCTESYTYKVMDVAEEVDANRNKLTECHDEAAKLAAQAQASLSASESMLEHAQSQIKRKEKEIKEKTAEAASKRLQKAQLEAEIETKRQKIAQSEKEREERKEQAIVGVGLSVIGILGAPFTGGASLALTAAGGGLAGYKASRMAEFERDCNSLRQSISSLNTEISQNVQAVATLEREKTGLQSLIYQHQSDVTKRKSEHRVYQRKIEEADRARNEITTLKNHAASTKQNVVQALPELHKIKQSLEQCTTLVKERTLDVSTSSTFMERWTGSLPGVGTRIKKSREFNKQKLVMQQVSETLYRIHTEVPGLLPSSNEAKFLDIKPWNSGVVSVVDVGTPIPEVCYH